MSLLILLASVALAASPELVSLGELEPKILLEMRYAGAENFVGRPVAGYQAAKCLLSKPAAEALGRAQRELEAYGLGLKVFDCYRPQRAVDDFARWARDLMDLKTKERYYPRVPKQELFARGYIAEKSGHSRASTVDLTLLSGGSPLDMGTDWDLFDERSHTAYAKLKPERRRNRLLLKSVMERHGFKNLPEEWWHYTLREEPYPNAYFDQPIE